MDFNHPLRYPGIDHDEYACREDWARYVSGTEVPLQIYHKNMSWPAGTVRFAKDPDSGEDMYLYDKDLVMRVLRENGLENSRLYKKLAAGLTPALSTEYDCDTEYNKEKGVWVQKRFRNVSVALVDQGNCPDWLCELKRLNEQWEQVEIDGETA